MPIYSGGGGGGAGASAPLTLTGTNAATVPLTVKGAAAQASDFFLVAQSDGSAIIEVAADGAGHSDAISITGGDANSNFSTGRVFSLSGTGIRLAISTHGCIITGANAATLDGDLNPGNVGLWLDQTPGATKLMVKAADSGGTIRTAAIALA